MDRVTSSLDSPNPSSSRLFQRRPSAPESDYLHTTPIFHDAASPSHFGGVHTPRFAIFQDPITPIPPPPVPYSPLPPPPISPLVEQRPLSPAGPPSKRFKPSETPSLASDATPPDFFENGPPTSAITSALDGSSSGVVSRRGSAVERRNSTSTGSLDRRRTDVVPVESISVDQRPTPLLQPNDEPPSGSTSPVFPPPPFPFQYTPIPPSTSILPRAPTSYQPYDRPELSPPLSRPTSILSLQSETSSLYSRSGDSSPLTQPRQSSIHMNLYSSSSLFAPPPPTDNSFFGFGSLASSKRLRKLLLRAIGLVGVIVLLVRAMGISSGGITSLDLDVLGSEVEDSETPKPTGNGDKEETKLVDLVEEERKELREFRKSHLWAIPETTLKTQVVNPTAKHEETVIFLHGLAQHTWDSPMSNSLKNRFPSVKWVMPQAPQKIVFVRNNESTPAWFDMHHFPYENAVDEDVPSLFLSARQINDVIRQEQTTLIEGLRKRGGMDSLPLEERVLSSSKGKDDEDLDEFGTSEEREWASERIVLAGFSQGGVMTLLTGLTARDRLAGLVVMSGFMPLRVQMLSLMEDLDRTTLPIFWGHGKSDSYLLHDDAVVSLNLLQSTTPSPAHEGGLGLSAIEFHSYPGLGHSWMPGEMTHIGNWLEKVLPSFKRPRDVKTERAKRR